MATSLRTYSHGTHLRQQLPWGTYLSGRALCPDGRVRALARIAQTADTFFSVPAAVKVAGRTVTGFVTVETLEGFSTPTDDDPAVVKFFPVKTGRNARIFDALGFVRLIADAR